MEVAKFIREPYVEQGSPAPVEVSRPPTILEFNNIHEGIIGFITFIQETCVLLRRLERDIEIIKAHLSLTDN